MCCFFFCITLIRSRTILSNIWQYQSVKASDGFGGSPYCGISHICLTCLEDQQVQRVVSQVGGSSDFMCGDPHEQLLVVSPCQQQTASRQTQYAVLIDARFQRQHLQLLLTNTELNVRLCYRSNSNIMWEISQNLVLIRKTSQCFI